MGAPKLVICVIVAVLAVAPGSCAAATRPPADTAATARPTQHPVPPELDDFFRKYFAAVETGEPDGIIALIDSDFVIRWGGRPLQDPTELRALLSRLQAAVRQDIEWRVLEGRVAGDWAWARVYEESVHHPRSGGDIRVDEGSHLVILRRSGDRWLMHRNHAAAEPPPASPSGVSDK